MTQIIRLHENANNLVAILRPLISSTTRLTSIPATTRW